MQNCFLISDYILWTTPQYSKYFCVSKFFQTFTKHHNRKDTRVVSRGEHIYHAISYIKLNLFSFPVHTIQINKRDGTSFSKQNQLHLITDQSWQDRLFILHEWRNVDASDFFTVEKYLGINSLSCTNQNRTSTTGKLEQPAIVTTVQDTEKI